LSGGTATVPVVVRNNTSDTLAGIEIAGTARSGGALVGSGSSQELAPANVKPGEFTMGYVFFSNSVPTGSTYSFTVTGRPAENPAYDVDLRIAEVNRRPDEFGTDSIIGIVSNPMASPVTGPVSVLVMCFQGSTPGATATGFTDADSVAPHGTASFSVNAPEGDCPVYAIGSSGYS
jgi:hypothetical protein